MESVGRRLALMVATVVFIVGAILLTVATDQLSYVYAGRALVGLGVGGITCAAPAMLAEISVPAVRGQLVGLYEIAYQVGAVVGVRLALLVVSTCASVLRLILPRPPDSSGSTSASRRDRST